MHIKKGIDAIIKRLELIWKIAVIHKWAILTIIAALIIHFWYLLLHFSTVLYGGPGDHTAGIIWLYQQNPTSPWWNFTSHSAYPFGDNLWSPAYIFSQGEYILFWLFARLFRSGIAGYNAITLFGLVISYFSLYFVATKISKVKKYVIAILSYAAVFNPFMLSVISVGHFSYVFAPCIAALLIYYLWRYYIMLEKNKKNLIVVGALLGSTWLIDPYFILFAGILVGGFLSGLYLRSCINARQLVFKADMLRAVGVIALITGLFFAPLILFSAFNATKIKDQALSVRSEIHIDAQLYSARIKDYLLPSITNPLMPTSVKNYKLATFHGKDKTFTTYIGWTIILIAAIYTVLIFRIRKRMSPEEKSGIFALLVTIIVLFIFSLPPEYVVRGVTVHMPSYYLVSFVQIWRVLARAYIFIVPVFVLYIIYAIQITTKKINMSFAKRRALAFTILALCVLAPFDLLNRNPFTSKNYFTLEKSLPTTYTYVKDRNDIKTIAEYPLREAPHYRGSYYITAQLYHGKNIFNSINPVTHETLVRESMMDLANPQTIPALKFMGVDAISVWNNGLSQWAPRANEGLTAIDEDSISTIFGKDKVVLYSLSHYDEVGRYLVTLDWDARMTNGEILHDVIQDLPKEGSFKVVDLCNLAHNNICVNHETDQFNISAKIRNESTKQKKVIISSRGLEGQEYVIKPNTTVDVKITSVKLDESIKIATDNPIKMYIFGYYAEPIEENNNQ